MQLLSGQNRTSSTTIGLLVYSRGIAFSPSCQLKNVFIWLIEVRTANLTQMSSFKLMSIYTEKYKYPKLNYLNNSTSIVIVVVVVVNCCFTSLFGTNELLSTGFYVLAYFCHILNIAEIYESVSDLKPLLICKTRGDIKSIPVTWLKLKRDCQNKKK